MCVFVLVCRTAPTHSPPPSTLGVWPHCRDVVSRRHPRPGEGRPVCTKSRELEWCLLPPLLLPSHLQRVFVHRAVVTRRGSVTIILHTPKGRHRAAGDDVRALRGRHGFGVVSASAADAPAVGQAPAPAQGGPPAHGEGCGRRGCLCAGRGGVKSLRVFRPLFPRFHTRPTRRPPPAFPPAAPPFQPTPHARAPCFLTRHPQCAPPCARSSRARPRAPCPLAAPRRPPCAAGAPLHPRLEAVCV